MNTTPMFAAQIDLNTRVEVFIKPNTVFKNKSFVGHPFNANSDSVFTLSTDKGYSLTTIPISEILLIDWRQTENPS